MKLSSILRHVLFVVFITVVYGATYILIDFIDTPVSNFKDILLLALKCGYMVVMTGILLYFLSIKKYIFAVFFPLLTLLCAALSYYKLTFHVELTQMVIDLALVNDFRTSADAVSWQLLLLLLFVLLISIKIVVYRFKKVEVYKSNIQLIVFLIILLIIDNTYVLSKPLVRHTPFSIYYSFVSYFENKRTIAEERPEFNEKIVCNSDSLVVVFVLGESLSAKNMQLNGYHRPTTPYMMKEKNLINYPHIYSEYGYTHESVPYILTRADHEHPDLGYEERSFISILKKAGYRTTWLANQESGNTFIYFMNECDSLINISNGKSLFIFDKWLDEDIFPHYKNVLSEDYSKKFILVHTIGSHWYYNNHFPDSFTHFKPITNSKMVSSNTHEQMLNSYDNTVVYSDYIWYHLINEIRNKPAIMLYLSDHSENLGEDGHYTHGDGDWPAQHYPGCFIWYSNLYQEKYPEKIDNLRKNSHQKYNTSFLFHSILDAADIQTPCLNENEDIFN